jgi:hypothetical protein
MQWLYTKKLPVGNDDSGQEYQLLAKSYVLGEKLMDLGFKRSVLKGLIAKSLVKTSTGEFFPTGATMNIIFNGTPEGSPARHLMVDFWVYIAHSN